MKKILALVVFTSLLLVSCSRSKTSVSPEEARALAKEAYIYGNPLVDNYRIIYNYFVDSANPEFKARFNTVRNIPKVYTPEDKAVQTPNSDTPYSMACLDLRAEPVVITVPAIEENRYFSIQLIDGFTHNFYYIGSRTTGNTGGNYLFVGPDWTADLPAGFTEVVRCETQFAVAVIRTQLFDPSDLENVKNVQAGYSVKTLSAFRQQAAPAPAKKIDFLQPLSKEDQKSSLLFFDQLNFWLQFCTVHPSEKELMDQLAKIGVVPGKTFDAEALSPELKDAMLAGIQDAWKALDDLRAGDIKSGRVTSGDLFGTREFLKNNYLYRFAGAVIGIYGNSHDEAMYPFYLSDANGQALDASKNTYTLTLRPKDLPPVNSFWSFTMYEMPASLLTPNPIDRYLINSPMLPRLKKNSDQTITLYIQHQSPGKDRESNWLPAPNGPFMVVLRLYWPKREAIDGTWKRPEIISTPLP